MAAVIMVFFVLAAIGIQVTQIKANPYYGPVPSIKIIVSSPTNGTIYATNNVNFRLSIETYPWGRDSNPISLNVECKLDGKVLNSYRNPGNYSYSGNYSVLLASLSEGTHYVYVKAFGTYSNPQGMAGIITADIPTSSSSGNIYFTIKTNTATPTPTPSPTPSSSPAQTPTLTPSPTPSTSPSASPFPTIEPTIEPIQTASPTPIGEPTMVAYAPQIAVGTVVSIAVVAAGILVYFKRRKG